MSADAILISKYKKNRPENAFREVVSTREVYGEKWRIFGLKIFRVLWETPESRFGSFAGRFPRARTRTARSGVERTNHEATALPTKRKK